MKKNKLYISGDSFCESRNYPYPGPQSGEQYAWFNEVGEYFKDTHELIVDSYGSRDVQTIIDNWIKILPHLKSNDMVIICIPMLIRQRVPLRKKDWMVNPYRNNKHKSFFPEIINRFVTHQSWYKTSSEKIWVGENIIEKTELDNHIEFMTQLNLCESIEQNYIEVINTLYDLTPAKKYVFSWDDTIKKSILSPNDKGGETTYIKNMKDRPNVIEYKKDITEKLGWSTRHDLYKETNGEAGAHWDFHWDYKFEKIWAEYIKNKMEQ